MDISTLSTIASFLTEKVKAKAFYPGLPFLWVPIVVLWFIAAQFEGSLLFSPSAKISALQLRTSVNPDGSSSEYWGTVLVVPSGAEGFVLPLDGKTMTGARLSVSPEELSWNRQRIALQKEAFTFENGWLGTRYPLTMVLEGATQEKMRSSGGQEIPIPKLELSTSDSVWITLGAVISAIFGIGLAAGFVKDSLLVLKEDASGNIRHEE